MPEGFPEIGKDLTQFSRAMDIAAKTTQGLAWAFGKVPASDHMVNRDTIDKMDAGARARMTQLFIELHKMEDGGDPKAEEIRNLIFESEDLKRNEFLKDTIDAQQSEPQDLLMRLNISDEMREVLLAAIKNPDRSPAVGASVPAAYQSIVNDAVKRLEQRAEQRVAKEHAIKKADARARSIRIREKEELRKAQRNEDASIYLAMTFLGRTGNVEAAKTIDVSYKAYKQLSFLSKQNVEAYGTAAMTAGYVGVALMLADHFISSSSPSAEQQMMAQMKQMFDALQKSIEDFREEVNERFDGLDNGQAQILNSIKQAHNSLQKTLGLNFVDVQNSLRDISSQIRLFDQKRHDQVTRQFRSRVRESGTAFNRLSVTGPNPHNLEKAREAFEFLIEQTSVSRTSGLHSIDYKGVSINTWKTRVVSDSLKPESIMSPDFHVGTIPAIIDRFYRDESSPNVRQIPNPVEWSEVVGVLLAAYYQFPGLARSVETYEGSFLDSIDGISKNIDRSIQALLSERTVRKGMERYSDLTRQLVAVMEEVHDEVLIDLRRRGAALEPLSTDLEYAAEKQRIGPENLPQLYPVAFSEAQIQSIGQLDARFSDGQLNITLPDLPVFTVTKERRASFEGQSHKSEYINAQTIKSAKKRLYRAPTAPNSMFINRTHWFRKGKGSAADGPTEIQAPNGQRYTVFYHAGSLRVYDRFETAYDILGLAQNYGLVRRSDGRFQTKPVHKAKRIGYSRQRAAVLGENYQDVTYTFATGADTKFTLRRTRLVAPTNPRNPIFSKRKSEWMSTIVDDRLRTDLTGFSHRLIRPVRRFGSSESALRVSNSSQLVQALHQELYVHQRRTKTTILSDIRSLLIGVSYSDGMGLQKGRYEKKLATVSRIVEELEATASSLRYIASMGLMARGVDREIAADVAKNGALANPNHTDLEMSIDAGLPTSAPEFAAIIQNISMPAQAPLNDHGLPINFRDYMSDRFQAEMESKLARYYARRLKGLENAIGLPANKSIPSAIQGLEYVV